MKALVEYLSEYLYIIIAIVIGIIMITFLFRFFPSESVKDIKSNIPQRLATLAEECWKKHRYGLDYVSDVCNILSINNKVNESEITKFLKCINLPNSECYPDNCSYCSSDNFEDDDKLIVFVEDAGEVKISYADRKIIISLTNCDYKCQCRRLCIEKSAEMHKSCKNYTEYGNCRKEVDNFYESCVTSCE